MCPLSNRLTVKETYDWFVSPTDEDQTFFDSWDFVSMHTLKIELGIHNDMAVHDQSFKVTVSSATNVQQYLLYFDRSKKNIFLVF